MVLCHNGCFACDSSLWRSHIAVWVFGKHSERNNEFLHCSEKTIADLDGYKEVNCSLEKTAWKVIVFDHASPADEPDLRCNNIIFLMDPEAKVREKKKGRLNNSNKEKQ